MNSKQAKEIPIEVFLNTLGNKPVKSTDNDIWYISPLRLNEKTASFKVNKILNTWYDFGLGKGGSIIDLVIEMYNDNVSQALKRLSSSFATYSPAKYQHHQPSKRTPKLKDTLILDKVTKISEKALFCLLSDRCINQDIAKQYLHQIYFSIKDRATKNFALAMNNYKGGHEFKNKYMKGCIGPKSIITINLVDGKNVVIFEGMMDFLAFLSHHSLTRFQSSAIILNSVYLKDDALKILNSKNFKKAYFFLDNDQLGKEAFEYLSSRINIDFEDKSNLYEGFKDYNEYLIAQTGK